MDNFEDDYKKAVEAGQRNLQARVLLRNWCFHAELVRSGGIGMIEEATGFPIGHFGVQCKFSKKNTMCCWLIEDAVYDFYQNNCKNCKERVPIGIPNIMSFIASREEAAEIRKSTRAEEEKKRKQWQADRRSERATLRHELSLEETFVFDLLDELDQEGTSSNDPRLEQLANLAPESFTRKVIEHLLPAVLHESLPYSIPAAKALLSAPLTPKEKLLVAMCLVSSYEETPAAIDVVLSKAEKLSQGDLITVLVRFVSLALGSPPGIFGGSESITLDTRPINALFQKRRDDICTAVDALIVDANPEKVGAAVEIIIATDSDELFSRHIRSIFAKLMRRRTLLPGERRDSSVLYYLRQAASTCFERFPEETDKTIQSFLTDKDDIGRKEAYKIYRSVLNQHYQEQEKVQIGVAQKLAFKRLLWAAIDIPEDNMDEAGQFFRCSPGEFARLAVEHFDDLIGAAATLSEKYQQIDTKSDLIQTDDVFSHMERSNKHTAIDSLQGALIKWAAVGAKSKGREGIEEFLELYRSLPEDQTQMRGNMIVHVSTLLTGVESLTLVLSDWYRALMDGSTLVRASAVQAWEDVPYDLVKNFPDLFFEAFSVLLLDPYVIVHRSAVHALRRRSFPEDKRDLIRQGLLRLIICYFQQNKQESFIVDCIDVLSSLCLSPEEEKGWFGQWLLSILLDLEGAALYDAIDKLHYGFKDIPGFVKVALKSIQDEYTRHISIDDCGSTILRAPNHELQNCIDDITKAFKSLMPFRSQGFDEALLYTAALTKAGSYAIASNCFKELITCIPLENRNELWRLKAVSVAVACEIEQAITVGELPVNLIDNWKSLIANLEKENEERAKLRNFPPSFFL